MIHKEPSPYPGFVLVTFELPASVWAERVNVVGDFNDWDPQRDELHQSRTNCNWHCTLVLPSGREFHFRYLLNGKDWQNDWHADKYVPNQYGTDNSVVCT